MIDTVVLQMTQNTFHVNDHSLFEPNSKGLFKPPYTHFNGQFIKCTQNPSLFDTKTKNYKPRLTLIKRKPKEYGQFEIHLKIELSLPKLMFGNNFDELNDSDFPRVLQRLKDKLMSMGVATNEDELAKAKVHTIHYGKNILFEDYTTVTSILSQLEKINLTRKLDLGKTDYQNGGELVRYHSNQFQIVFYDKISELKRTPKRAAEKNDRKINLQPSLFESVRKEKPFEVLRYELRLINQRNVKKAIERAGVITDTTFQALFQKYVARKILRHHWQKVFDSLKPVLLEELSPLERLEFIMKQQTKVNPQKAIAMVGLSIMIQEEGFLKTRRIIESRYNYRSMQRLYKEIESLPLQIHSKVGPIEKVDRDLNEFHSLRITDHPDIQKHLNLNKD